MNVSLRVPQMTRDQFLDWAAQQETPFEFDGFEPVAMTGGSRRHALLCGNLHFALRKLLDGSAFDVLFEAGLATGHASVRYPDVMVLPKGGSLDDRLMPEPLVVFEVISPTSERVDRTFKPREYRGVTSIQRYVIVDKDTPSLDVFSRQAGASDWIAGELTTGGTLEMPEIGISLSVDDIFRDVFDLPSA